MRTIKRIKKECKLRGLNVDNVLHNLMDIEQYRYKSGKLYFTRFYLGGKPIFHKDLVTEVDLADYE